MARPSLWNLILGMRSFFTLVKNPADLDKVFHISKKLATPEVLNEMVVSVENKAPYCKRALDQRYRINFQSLEKISFSEGSLGKAYLEFMAARGLDPNNIPTLTADNPNDFILAHLYETHDLWHVICGFDTDISGELGLQAFYCAQIPTPLSPLLLSSGFLNTALFAMKERTVRMKEISRGWQMGTRARPLFGVDWSQYWNKSLVEIRQDFQISA